VSDGDSLVGLPRREQREPRIGTPADQSPDEATIMAVTSEEAKRRGLPTDGASIRASAAQQPARRHASTMQDAIGAELLGLLEQAVPGSFDRFLYKCVDYYGALWPSTVSFVSRRTRTAIAVSGGIQFSVSTAQGEGIPAQHRALTERFLSRHQS